MSFITPHSYIPSASLVADQSVTDDDLAGATIGTDTNPVQSSHPAQVQHLSKSRQYYRDMMLGVNDGLVSTFLLVVGVVGGGMDVTGVLLTAIAGAIAGAISMFAGEFVATKSQNEVMKGEIKLEREHIKKYHAEEVKELSQLLTVIGIPGSPATERKSQSAISVNDAPENEPQQMRRSIISYYASNPDALLKIMIALEFGVIDGEVRSPVVAGGTSFVSFLFGALPSVIPFIFVADISAGVIISGVATGIGLFLVGVLKSLATRGNPWRAALENLAITAVGSGIAYGIGVGFDRLVNDDLPEG
jgi:VIT1/CCC1 family predicted Fe2+/Mn2+ transporter